MMNFDVNSLIEMVWNFLAKVLAAVLPAEVFDRLAAVPMPIEDDMAL
ncbi:MAG: hypothetical protein IJ262_06360 [Clostridia bacterium]|nr:hypothetical protein [Clostridia bacterium]